MCALDVSIIFTYFDWMFSLMFQPFCMKKKNNKKNIKSSQEKIDAIVIYEFGLVNDGLVVHKLE